MNNYQTSFLEKIKSAASIAQSVFTVGAIIGAGLWFWMQGTTSPRANISHTVTHRQINDKLKWIHVTINIFNEGKKRLDVNSGNIRVQQILPLHPTINKIINRNESPISSETGIVPWPNIGDTYKLHTVLKIESGESDSLNCEFFVLSTVQTVKIYSYFERQERPPIGWSATTIYDLTSKEENKDD